MLFQNFPSSARHSSLAQLAAQEKLRHFSLLAPLPATRGQTTALLQSALVTKIATGHLDAACYRAADEKKTLRPGGKELHCEQTTQIPQYGPEASATAIQEYETEGV